MVLKYMKEFFKKTEASKIAEGLTEQQKKNYRKQALWIYIYGFLVAFAFIGAIVEIITLDTGIFFFIAIILLFLKGFFETFADTHAELLLIRERIVRRLKKNKKRK